MKTIICAVCLSFSLPMLNVHAQSQGEMNQQAGADFEKKDAAMNRTYQKLAKALDNHGRAKLQAAQRAWLAFRDTQAELEVDLAARGGSVAPLIRSETCAELTELRTRQLEMLFKENASLN